VGADCRDRFRVAAGHVHYRRQGVILRVNQAFTEITGYSAEECVGRTPSCSVRVATTLLSIARCTRVCAHTGAWQGEIWNRRKNDEIFPEWLTISAVKDSEGWVTHYVSTLMRHHPAQGGAGRDPASGLLRSPDRPAESPPAA
jgi:PAS domain S-box-containing protein